MKDPYQTLGVRRTASADEIKRSYRRLAKKLHPDINPDERVEQQFRDVTAAYELLSDAAKRTRFDRGEIDASGTERGFGYTRRDAGGGRRPPKSGKDDVFVEDIISELFRSRHGAAAGPGGGGTARGSDASFTLVVPFIEAALGAKKPVTLADDKTLNITVPSGIESGQTLRLKGQGNAGTPNGDALIEIQIEPHPVFTRKGRDIHSEVAVTLPEAVLGGSVTVLTVHGAVALKVPPGSNSGTILRLKGKGLPMRGTVAAGDHYVTLRVVLPEAPDPDLIRFLETWSLEHGYTVRPEPSAQ